MAIDPVLIRFATAGVADVSKAFDTIEARMIKAEEAATKESERSTKKRIANTKEEVATREKILGDGTKTSIKLAEQEAKEHERLEKYKLKVQLESAKMAGREAENLNKLEQREAQKTAREVERLEQYKQRVRIRSSEMAMRATEEEARAEERTRARISRGIGHSVTRGVGHSIGSMASLAGGTLAIGGGFALAEIAGRELAAQKTAALLVNAVTTGTAPPPGANVASILAQASTVSQATGMGKEELIGGTLEYSRKARGGDFQGAMANMGFFAKLSKTTGTDINDIAAAAGTLQSQNTDLKAPEMQQMLLDVYAQGKAGSMSMIDVAKQVGILSSTRSSYQGNAADNQRKLLALGQLAAPEGTVEEAGTFIKNLSAEAGSHRKSTKETVGLEQMGVKYDKYGRMESPEQMISSVFKGTGGDITKIEKIFGLRGTALFRSLQPAYAQAGGGDAGVAAVQAKMASVTGATMTSQDLDAQMQQLMSTPAERFQKALNQVSEVVSERVEPILTELANKLEENKGAIEHFMTGILDVAEWLVQNPWKGIGTAVTLSITKELAVAGIGQLVGQALTNRIGQGGGIVAAAAAITITGMAIIDWLANKDVGGQKGKLAGELGATNLASDVRGDIRSGKVTPADVAKIQQEIATQEAAKKKLEGDNGVWGGMPIAGGSGLHLPAIAQALGMDPAGAARHKAEMDNSVRTLKDLNVVLVQATAALRNLGSAATNDPARHVPIGSPGR